LLRWTIVDVTPSEISLSEADGADPKRPAVTLTINVRQATPNGDPRPLTICTAHTILGDGDPSIRISMRARGADKYLLGDPLFGVHMRYAIPSSDDWKTELPFVTIPPGSEGLTVTKTITWEHFLQARGKAVSEERRPRPGDEYELVLCKGRRETFTEWWNWGDLQTDLKDRRLVNLVNPKLNGVEHADPPPEPILLPYAAWEEECDDEGNDFVRLLVHLDTTPVVVRFIE
jgi:hypothetical protein